jgi:hypothetical protein
MAAGNNGSGCHKPFSKAEKKHFTFFAAAHITLLYICPCEPVYLVEKQQLSKHGYSS